VPAIAALNRFAAERKLPLIATADAHTENDPEFSTYPPHCVIGTVGQTRPQATLIPAAERIVIEKQKLDCFSNRALPGILDRLAADRYVVYGVVTELCVRCASFGLLDRGSRVELITDAVKSLSSEAADAMLREFTARGGILTTVAEVVGTRPLDS
jgi:nicotinamidase/pyrazinamidase